MQSVVKSSTQPAAILEYSEGVLVVQVCKFFVLSTLRMVCESIPVQG